MTIDISEEEAGEAWARVWTISVSVTCMPEG